jgi:hypothetical protein
MLVIRHLGRTSFSTRTATSLHVALIWRERTVSRGIDLAGELSLRGTGLAGKLLLPTRGINNLAGDLTRQMNSPSYDDPVPRFMHVLYFIEELVLF